MTDTSDTSYDVVIIGAGPAGIQAAIHASRKKTKVLLLGRIENSALFGAHVENYAFVDGIIDGHEMLRTGVKQAQSFGTEISHEDVLHIKEQNPFFSLTLESGRSIQTRSLIFSIGVSKKKLNVPGEKDFSGRGVSYCVDCDANFYRGATVAVTGNKSAAVDGALTLLEYASQVYLISEQLEVSPELNKRLKESQVEVITSTIEAIHGEHAVKSLTLSNKQSIEIEGIFIELGSKGALELATQVGAALDTESFQFIQTNDKQETNIKGIYAAGDITGPPLQVAKAVGEGCIAGMEAAKYAKAQKQKE